MLGSDFFILFFLWDGFKSRAVSLLGKRGIYVMLENFCILFFFGRLGRDFRRGLIRNGQLGGLLPTATPQSEIIMRLLDNSIRESRMPN